MAQRKVRLAQVAAISGFVYTQTVPATEWVISHDLNKYPNVTVLDDVGDVVYTKVNVESPTVIRVKWKTAMTGKVILS